MTYSDVTSGIRLVQARIAQIQGLGQAYSGTAAAGVASTSGTDFASTLAAADSRLTRTSLSPLTTPAQAMTGKALATFARGFTGTPYVAGGESPRTGWDCARFTQWVARQFGVNLPAVSWEQIKTGEQVPSLAEARAGDLLFFHEPGGHRRDPSPLKVNHVAIYLGDGKMVEAANPQKGTVVSPVDSAHLVGIRRIAGSDAVVLPPAAAPQVSASGAMSPTQLDELLRRVGFTGDGLRTAWAVAMRESGGRPGAIGALNSNGTRDHGLFQLNDIHVGRSIDPSRVYDAEANAAAALRMTQGGTNWSSWAIGNTGWAANLQRESPDVFAALNAKFQEWYARYPSS